MTTAEVTTVQVNDGQSHTATVERKEQFVTLVIDNSYVARATSPGDDSTLDVEKNGIYLGASVDSDGKSSSGFIGCITGPKLNHKDLPLGGSTNDFAVSISSSVESGCNIEPPQGVFPTVATIAGGVGFLILLIIIPIAIVICIGGRYTYRRRKNRYSPRDGHGSSRSPVFNWQPVQNRTPDTGNSRQRLMLTQSSQISVSESFALHEVNPGLTQSSLGAPSTPRISEYRFTTPEPTPEQIPRRRSREHLDQEENEEPSPQANRNIRGLDLPRSQTAKPIEPPFIPKHKRESSSPVKDHPPMHMRSMSGHQSIATTATERSVFDDSEVGRYVVKRIQAADEEIESLDIDQMISFKEEGEFEPLGSLESLHDIVIREENLSSHPLRPSVSKPTTKPKPTLPPNRPTTSTEHPKTSKGVKQVNKHTSDTTRVSAPRETSSHHLQSNGVTSPNSELNKARDKRRRNRAPPVLEAGESLMDRFQKISTNAPL